MSALSGTWALVRLNLRRDRVRLAIWTLSLAGITTWAAAAVIDLYPNREALAVYARTISGNTAVIALSAPPARLDTYGGRVAFEIWQYGIAVALMAVFAVSRSARAEEELGRAELVRATAVGRHAHSTAALIANALSMLLLAVLLALGLVIAGLDAGGSLVLGLAFASVGLTFGSISLLAGQFTAHARTASSLAGMVIALTYLLRAVGDTSAGGLSWASPFGWGQAARPFAGDRIWPLLIAVGASAAIAGVAIALERRRDHGAGLVAPRPGPSGASPRLNGPFGLAWRLHRASILWWVVGGFATAVLMGTVADDADDLVGDNDAFKQYLSQLGGASLAEVFLATLLAYLALAAAGFAIQALLRLRAEELAHRAELVLSGPLSRTRWAVAEAGVTLFGVVAVLVACGAGLGLGYGLSIGDAGQAPRLAAAALAYVPAVAIVGASVLLLGGIRSSLAPLAWAFLAFCSVEMMLGQVLGLPDWLRDLSPLHHLASIPYEAADAGVIGMTVAVLLVLTGAGLLALRRRDLSG